jgi:enoyl-CoA hydratase/carnithine racemase
MNENKALVFSELPCRTGSLGLVTLNPQVCQVFTLDMYQALHAQLQKWKSQDDIRLLFFHSDSDDVFSRGADLNTLASESSNRESDFAHRYFWWEYACTHLIHQFPKPVAFWLSGLVTGSSIGLSAGASHRIASENSVFSFPEVSYGFYPDNGAALLLEQLPQPIALFLAWTGVSFTGADATDLKLASLCLPSQMKRGTLLAITETDWSKEVEENHWRLSDILGNSEMDSAPHHRDALQTVLNELKAIDLNEAFVRLLAWNTKDPWIRAGIESFKNSLSAHVVFHYFKKTRGLSSTDVLARDWSLALNLLRDGDFQKPKWKHQNLMDISTQEIQSVLSPVPKEKEFQAFLKNSEAGSIK